MEKPVTPLLSRQQLVDFLGQGCRAVHLMGIGGTGMSGLARLLIQKGHLVSGCDHSANGEVAQLRRLGARVQTGHGAGHVTTGTELVVYSSAIGADQPELVSARTKGVPIVRRGLVLSALMNHRCNIAVAGTHGKTTTTAMIAQILKQGDSAPSFCVGAQVPALGTNAQLGAGQYFVAEVDESDGTLVGFTPHYAVCLNIEAEHLDYHGSIEALQETFHAFLDATLQRAFYGADCPNAAALGQHVRSGVSFGLSSQADYQAVELEPTARGTRFRARCRGQEIGAFGYVLANVCGCATDGDCGSVLKCCNIPLVNQTTCLTQCIGN
ncbi:hypothetical protein HQ590_03875 [bacterium]|nr:hypothetical protein [bacterium]